MTYELYRRRIEIDNYKKTQLLKTGSNDQNP
jgi:hypothetical protein